MKSQLDDRKTLIRSQQGFTNGQFEIGWLGAIFAIFLFAFPELIPRRMSKK